MLLADPDYGTSFDGMPVMWPVGFTGERAGGEVVVLDSGKIVATTGREYYISFGRVGSAESDQLLKRVGAFPAAANCPYPWDLVDCGTPDAGSPGSDATYCRAPEPPVTPSPTNYCQSVADAMLVSNLVSRATRHCP